MKNMQKIVLVDGSGFIYRAFFALPPLTKSNGTPIGAVYGFTNILISMLTNNSMDYFAIILDKAKKSFRHDLYPQYKQNRRETPPELIPQFKIIREVCQAFDVPAIEEDNYEADDLMAAYARLGLESGFRVKLVSGDKDLIQLIRPGVELYDPLKTKEITEEEVFKKYGIRPDQMIDFLALCGDSADNIPGVASVGPKTASKLLSEYGTLENIIEETGKISKKKKFQENIIAQAEIARLSQKLATINADAPCNVAIENLRIRSIDVNKAKKFLEQQEFNSLIPKLNGIKHIKTEHHYSEVGDVYKSAKIGKIICITDRIICTPDEKEAIVDLRTSTSELLEILESPNILKLTNNAKQLFHITENLVNFEDIAVMSFLANGKDASFSTSLDSYKLLMEKLENTGQKQIYENVEKPLIAILAKIEKTGFRVEADRLRHLLDFFDQLLETIRISIAGISSDEINLDSPKQVADLLFNKLNIRSPKAKKNGTASTNQTVLEELAQSGHEIALHILEWRQISKLRSTYTTALINKISTETGRIHTTLNITNTLTGRLSSSDPNLQNIPVKTNIGLKIREAFVADTESTLISMDYSQIELRILAELSGCEKLLSAFKNNLDVHTITASELFHVPVEAVTDDLRRRAKAINFGIIYGMTSFGISKRVNMSGREASQFIEHYFAKYPEVKRYMDDAIKAAYEKGYASTVLGRRCFIPNISSNNYQLRKFAERQAVNAPIQGSSADIMSVAMINISKNPQITAKLILQIHDELIFEAPKDQAESQAALIQKVMEGVNLIKCPLIVNKSIGKNWGEL